MEDPSGIPACFSFASSVSHDHDHDPSAVTRSGQSVFMSVYRTKVADHCRLINITWCKNSMLHGLSVSLQALNGDNLHTCKLQLKPLYFWRKHGSKSFTIDGKHIHVYWDLKAAKFNGETEPASDYYVAVVCEQEVVLLVGDMRKDAYRKTGCRPALIDPILISNKEHIFGKKKFSTRAKFYDKGKSHEISIECKNHASAADSIEPEMEIRIDGHLAVHVKHLQWKFRGNDSISLHKQKLRLEVYWDVHDWLFSPGLRHALFIFKPVMSSMSPSSSGTMSPLLSPQTGSSGEALGGSEFSLFLYAWKIE